MARKKMKKNMTQMDVAANELAFALLKWKQLLGLSDWRIQLKWANDVVENDGAWARVSWGNHANKAASISFTPITDSIWARHDAQSLERTLVHELMHLVLYPLSRKKSGSLEEETVINTIATALTTQDK